MTSVQQYSGRDQMPFPLNNVFLLSFAQLDFLAVLSLAITSKGLKTYIYDHIVSVTTFTEFIRRNQNALTHDAGFEKRAFTKRDLSLILGAFQRIATVETVYEQFVPILGVLIAQLPFKSFRKSHFPEDSSVKSQVRISHRERYRNIRLVSL